MSSLMSLVWVQFSDREIFFSSVLLLVSLTLASKERWATELASFKLVNPSLFLLHLYYFHAPFLKRLSLL